MFPNVDDPTLDVRSDGDRVIARIASCTGLTEKNAAALGKLLTATTESHAGGNLAIDMTAITFITSDGLAKLVSANSRMKKSGGHFSLINLHPDVRDVFAVTKLDRIIDIPSSS